MKTAAKFSVLSALLFAFASAAFADGVVIYNTVPSPLPPSNASRGYEATSTGEFGNLIQFTGDNPYTLVSATVAMDTWALASNYTADFGKSIGGVAITSAGFTIPLTLNIYDVGPEDTVGSSIETATIDAFIPWRNAPDPTDCPSGSGYPNNINQQWLGPDGNCYNGQLMTVTLNLPGVAVPGQVIYGLAFNTPNYGTEPTGTGPSTSLNFGVTQSDPTVGSNPLFGSAYADPSSIAGDSSMAYDYTGQIEFTGIPVSAPVPEPFSLLFFGTGLFGLAAVVFRKAKPLCARMKP